MPSRVIGPLRRKCDWMGLIVRSPRRMRTGIAAVPAGHLFLVTRNHSGLYLDGQPCACCGRQMVVNQVKMYGGFEILGRIRTYEEMRDGQEESDELFREAVHEGIVPAPAEVAYVLDVAADRIVLIEEMEKGRDYRYVNGPMAGVELEYDPDLDDDDMEVQLKDGRKIRGKVDP